MRRIERAEAYLTDDGGMLDMTREDMRFAVVEVNEADVSRLLALFATEEDARQCVARCAWPVSATHGPSAPDYGA